MKRFLKIAGIGAILILVPWFFRMNKRYFRHGAAAVKPDREFYPGQSEKYKKLEIPMILHIVCGMTMLLLGPLQLCRPFRNRFPKVHRLLGKVYLTMAFLGAIPSVLISLRAHGGVPVAIAGVAKTFMHVVTAIFAIVRIKQGRVTEHREWMLRNYAIVFDIVLFRVWTMLVARFRLKPETVYQGFTWVSFLSVMIPTESYIHLSKKERAGSGASSLSP